MTEKEFRWWLRGKVIERHGSLKNYAKSKNVSSAWVSKMINKARLSDDLLDEFGAERFVIYRIKDA